MDNKSFLNSLQTGFIDKSILSDSKFHPELLVNNKVPPKKILSTLLQEFDTCNEFYISVAFVTTSGVATIINKLKELENKGVKGKLLVSQYLNFTQPEALKRLKQFSNIELRIATNTNTHSKGYIFRHNQHYNIIVGSSNLTAEALSVNKEWNIKVSALEKSGIVDRLIKEFLNDFGNATIVTDEYIKIYENDYSRQLAISSKNLDEFEATTEIKFIPNLMQVDALENIKLLRVKDKNKALIISATGTGKTFLSAFDAFEFKPKKLLFVVHRQNIAISAMNTFQKVFGSSKTMGIYSGSRLEKDCDFIFSTVQTISKKEHFGLFEKDYFDYIIVDETHRALASSYLKLIEYFNPKFLLGMTATPERSDGENIFELFDHNIAYEIRLNKAMAEDMLSSFHYYGVSDLLIDDKIVDDKTNFNLLVSENRVDRIIHYSRFYGSDNGITRGVIFCSRKDEAKELSSLLNSRGLKTVALTGESSEEDRKKAIERLESDSLSSKLDYILTVDIFNEGVDIPKINQIIMLRPTTSAIIFIQQLGRGLRKAEGKNYLTVIDFIGNYENNYLIPIALYGDTSYNKDNIRKLVNEGSKMIPGASTINFDEITKERIFKSIDSANLQLFADLKKDYELLKYKLGHTPSMMDFVNHGSRDPYLFVDYARSYYHFVQKVERNITGSLTEKEQKIIELFSKEINNSKRVEESVILKNLIEKGSLSIESFKQLIYQEYGYHVSNETIQSSIRNLNFEFIRENEKGKLITAKEKYQLDIINIVEGRFEFSNLFLDHLNNTEFKLYLLDSVCYSISQFDLLFNKDAWYNGFVLYRKYSRKDVFRILNVNENPVAQNVGGYLVSPNNDHCPIFVNYHKEDHISESTKYEDEFINNNEFSWMSKSKRKLNSPDVQSILGKNGEIRLPLFIKKSNDEGTDFYYMGELKPNHDYVEQTKMSNDSGGQVSVVRIVFNILPSVEGNIYNYINCNSISENVKTSEVLSESFENKQVIPLSKIINPLPFYNFYAAAGSFSEMQENKDFEFIEAPSHIQNTSDYFACKVVGESMNRVIPNNSICLFKKYSGGTRNGKIVLVENYGIYDQDFNSSFTVKTYSSEKVVTDERWSHTSIKLLPNSNDDSFTPIILNEETAVDMKIVGEFVSLLELEHLD